MTGPGLSLAHSLIVHLNKRPQAGLKEITIMRISQLSMVVLLSFGAAVAPIQSSAQGGPQAAFAFGEVRSFDGTPIGYLTAGSGPPLVIVHGALDTGDSWLPVAALLTNDFTVYVMSRRGRGRSGDVAPDNYSIQKEVEDVVAVLDAAGEGAYLLGHSYGALVALETAREVDVDRLILYEPPLAIGGPYVDTAFLNQYRELMNEARFEDALAISLRDVVAMTEEEIAGLRATPIWDGFVQLMPTFTRELEVVSQLPLGVDRYRGIAARTLLVVGELTPDLLTDGNAALQTMMPDAQTAVLEGQTHTAQFLAPHLVANEVRVFLNEPQPVASR